MKLENLSYRFKENAKKINFSLLINMGITAFVIYLGFLAFQRIGVLFKPGGLFSKTTTQENEGDDQAKAIKNAQLPKDVDSMKLEDRLNRLENLLYSLWMVDSEGIYKLLSDLTKNELDWIYLKFGVREYKHGFLDFDSENINLFGFFDRQVSAKFKMQLQVVFLKATTKYYPL